MKIVVKLSAAQRREVASEEGRRATEEEDSSLPCGVLVACFLPKYKDEIPQILK